MTKTVFGATPILNKVTATGVGPAYVVEATNRVYQCVLDTTGAPGAKAKVAVEVSLDGVNFDQLALFDLDAAAGKPRDSFASSAPWRHVRGHVLEVSGGGKVSLWVGV